MTAPVPLTASEMDALLRESHQSLAACREAAKVRKENPTDGAAQEKYAKAFATYTATVEALNLEQRARAAAETNAEFEKPANRLKYLGSEEQQKQKHAVHKDATRIFLKSGAAEAIRHMESQGFTPGEIHALISTTDNLGGFTVDHDFRAELVRNLAGFTVFRGLGARVIPTSSNPVVLPTLTAGTDPYPSDLNTGQDTGTPHNWKAEGHTTGGAAPPQQDRPTFGQLTIPVHVWQPDVIEVTRELLEDSALPLDSLLAELLGQQRALDEDWTFINGTGTGMPLGVCHAGSGIASGSLADVSDLLEYGDIIDLFVALPAQYRQNASWLMNSAMFGRILQIADTAERPLFPVNALPNTLLGRPMGFSEFMPNFAATAIPIVFGDFRFYFIVERVDFRLQRLMERFAPNIGILATARVGGRVARPAAFRHLTVQA